MKHLLMRICVSPFEYHSPLDVIEHNLIGNNSGNMLFQYSVLRTLMREDTKISFITENDRAQGAFSPDMINRTYDALVLPFANAFRAPFLSALREWTRLIHALTIPVIVVGIGLQDSLTPTWPDGFSFDEDVRQFVRAVLDHSASLGVRGSTTAAYLKHLGFPSSAIDIIGCPSMYLWGTTLPHKTPGPLTQNSVVGITGSVGNPEKIKKLLMKVREDFPHYYYIPQLMDDLKLMYAGVPILNNPKAAQDFPKDTRHPDFVNGRARFFLNMPSLLDFMPTLDFDIGTRFHGGVGPVLCGVPSLFMPTDSRVQELVDYHELIHAPYQEVTQDMDLTALYEKKDFLTPLKNHAQRAEHYLAFLQNSGLPVIDDFTDGSAPLDKAMRSVPCCPPLEAINTASPEELGERLASWHAYLKRTAGASAKKRSSDGLLRRASRKARNLLGRS